MPRVTKASIAVSAVWCLLVAVALSSTLDSLRSSSFDGLNNALQIPFALPWFLLPIGGIWSHETDAWVVAVMGWLNGVLILLFLDGWIARLRRRR